MTIHTRWIRYFPLKFHAPSPYRIIPTHVVQLALLLLRPPVTAQSTTGSQSQYPYGPEVNLNFSLTVIIIVLVSAFFFIGFFSIFILQCLESDNPSDSQPSAAANNRTRLPARGLDPLVINSFPILVYSSVKEHKMGKGALECAVCITEFEDFDTLRLLPKCGHVFHPECIDAWLSSHSTCPVCRSKLMLEKLSNEKECRSESINSSDGQISRSEDCEIQIQNRVSIDGQISRSEDCEIQIQNRVSIDGEEDVRRDSRNVRLVDTKKFPRSHSTGHSLVQFEENCDRYTLRLPEGVLKQIVTLNRTTSCVVVLPTEESSRSGSEDESSRGRSNLDRIFLRSDRVGRWGFSRMPPFFTRTGSSRPSKVGVDGDLTVGSSKIYENSVKTPFGCLAGGKGDGVEQSMNRPPV
ncbi:hypothetical protein LguiA_013689 [Lonicera macranthoides]